MIIEAATRKYVVLFTLAKNITVFLFHYRDPN